MAIPGLIVSFFHTFEYHNKILYILHHLVLPKSTLKYALLHSVTVALHNYELIMSAYIQEEYYKNIIIPFLNQQWPKQSLK